MAFRPSYTLGGDLQIYLVDLRYYKIYIGRSFILTAFRSAIIITGCFEGGRLTGQGMSPVS